MSCGAAVPGRHSGSMDSLLGRRPFSVFVLLVPFMACNSNCCVGLAGGSSSVVLLALPVSTVEKFSHLPLRLGVQLVQVLPPVET